MTAADLRAEIVTLLPRLRRFARSLTWHAADADDLVQIAVERALLRSDQWRPGSSVLNWVLGIIRNAWIDEVRSRRRSQAVFVREEGVAEHGESSTDRDFTRWSIQSALDRLAEEQRLAVSLVLVEGLSYREAADVMEVPIGTLTSRLARGRLALQELLSDDGAHAHAPGERT